MIDHARVAAGFMYAAKSAAYHAKDLEHDVEWTVHTSEGPLSGTVTPDGLVIVSKDPESVRAAHQLFGLRVL